MWKYGKQGFPHYHTERIAFFSYRSVAMRKRKKASKKEKRRLENGLKGVGKMDFEGGNGGNIECEWVTA